MQVGDIPSRTQKHARLLIDDTRLATSVSLHGPDGVLKPQPLLVPLGLRGANRHMALVCAASHFVLEW